MEPESVGCPLPETLLQVKRLACAKFAHRQAVYLLHAHMKPSILLDCLRGKAAARRVSWRLPVWNSRGADHMWGDAALASILLLLQSQGGESRCSWG